MFSVVRPSLSALLSRPLISLANNMPAALPPAPSLHDRMDGLAFLARSLPFFASD